MRKGLWLAMRLLIVALTVLSVLTFSASAYVLAPLHSWLLFNDWRFWRHWRLFPRLTAQARRLAFKMVAEPDYRGMTAFLSPRDWLAPPMMRPDRALVAVRGDWAHGAASCGACGRCCTEIRCPAFDPVTRLCGSYGSPFWRYFPCGRYPATQAQIEYYGCPKWAALDDRSSG